MCSASRHFSMRLQGEAVDKAVMPCRNPPSPPDMDRTHGMGNWEYGDVQANVHLLIDARSHELLFGSFQLVKASLSFGIRNAPLREQSHNHVLEN